MKSEIKGCSPSFLSLPLNQTFAFQHRRLRSHRGLSYAASPSVCPLKRRHLAPSFFLGTSKKANYSFCNTASLTCFNNSLWLKPSQDLLYLYREDMDSFRTCTCRIYRRQLEPTPSPSPAISQDTGAISISPAALRRQSKAPATQFDPHDYMHLLLFPVPLSVMLGGGWMKGLGETRMPFLPHRHYSKCVTDCYHWVYLLLLELWHAGLLHQEVPSWNLRPLKFM